MTFGRCRICRDHRNEVRQDFRSFHVIRWTETLNLGVQSDKTFGDDPNIVAQAFGHDVEMTTQIVTKGANLASQRTFDTVNVAPEGSDRLGCFGVHC